MQDDPHDERLLPKKKREDTIHKKARNGDIFSLLLNELKYQIIPIIKWNAFQIFLTI